MKIDSTIPTRSQCNVFPASQATGNAGAGNLNRFSWHWSNRSYDDCFPGHLFDGFRVDHDLPDDIDILGNGRHSGRPPRIAGLTN